MISDKKMIYDSFVSSFQIFNHLFEILRCI